MDLCKKLGLGTVQFGMDYGIANTFGRTSEDEVERILNFAHKNGIAYLDTASAYGEAEEVLGKNDISGFRTVSKFMPPEKGGTVEQELNKTLERLHVRSIYGYLAHRPEALLKDKEQWKELRNLKETGKVKKIGFSLNRPEELDLLLALGMHPDLIQVPYNFFDRRFKTQMFAMKNEGCEIHTRSAFLQGLFFKDVEELPNHFEVVKENIEALRSEHGENLSGALLKFVFDQDFIDAVIVGVNHLGQLKQNMENYKTANTIDLAVANIPETILMPSLWPKT